ncbi:LanC-like protein 2 [Aspergillus hancockii]|nr:LanC-like protein 2 [Aspergillus hancockii]
MSAPQYYPNTLAPAQTSKENLEKILHELRAAVNRGARMVQEGCSPSVEWGKAGLYTGVGGIALAFLRLDRQALSVMEPGQAPIDFGQLARERIVSRGPDIPLQPGRLSPLGSSSPVAATVMRILAAATSGSAVSDEDITCLQEAVKLALRNGHMVLHGGETTGGDEFIYGRAGLLWSILNLRLQKFQGDAQKHLQRVFDAVPDLVDVIIDAGRQGRKDYIKEHGEEEALPLMWSWKKFYLGAVHGITGILAVLLACRIEELNDGASRNYLPWIADTITGSCKICVANNGHLPTRVPIHSSSHHSYPLVQICHGSPGILLLMACARRNPLVTKYWEPVWDEAIYLATERTWNEGLLSKGGSLCHGIAGNALPLLMLHDSFEYSRQTMQIAKRNYMDRTQTTGTTCAEDKISSDYFLSRALALLLHAQETPPYSTSNIYRMPDHPFSLHEGLSGIVCAWADACVGIQARLRKMGMEQDRNEPVSETDLQRDPVFKELATRQLGFPTIVNYRPTGLF